jgi:hypothetical protein
LPGPCRALSTCLVRRTRVIDSALGRYRGNGNAEPEEEGFGDLVAAPVCYFS